MKEKDVELQKKIDMVTSPNVSLEKLAEYANNPQLARYVPLNPNVSTDLLYQLAGSKDDYVRAGVAMSSKCPNDLLVKTLNSLDDDFKIHIAMHPSSSTKVLEILSKDYNYQIHVFFNDNSTTNIKYNCLGKEYSSIIDYYNSPGSYTNKLRFPKEYLSLYEMGIKTDNIEGYSKAFYILFPYLYKDFKSKDNQKFSHFTDQIKEEFNRRILNERFPEEILYYYYMSFPIQQFFSNEALNKIQKIGKSSEKVVSKGVKNRDVYLSNIKKDLQMAFDKKQDGLGIVNIYPFIEDVKMVSNVEEKQKSDFSLVQNKEEGYKVEIKCKSINYIKEKMKDGFIEFGYYPQDTVQITEKKILDILLNNNMLKKTDKSYSFNSLLGDKKYEEYIVSGRRFIKYNNDWIEVKPIKWEVNILDMTLKTTKDIIGTKSKNVDRISSTFFKDIITPYSIDDDLERKETENLNKEEKIIQKLELKEEEKRKLEDRKTEEERLKLRELELMSELDKVRGRLKEINSEPMSITSSKIRIEIDSLLSKVGDHIEFNKSYLPYLRYIDLTLVNSEKLKVDGIDFRGTNIDLNPQLVYKKNLSKSMFDDCNFTFKSFEGCDLAGADLSREKDCSGYEDAYTDENTLLPVKKEQSLNK